MACSSCDQWCSTESVWHHWKLHLLWSLWGKSLSADISLNLCIHSCDTCQNSYRNVTMEWKSGVSYWMTSHILMEKNEVSQQGVVIEWNTLNNGEDPLSWNQSASSWKPKNHRTRLHAGLCDYASVSWDVQSGHAWWMASTDFSVINFKKSLQTIYQNRVELFLHLTRLKHLFFIKKRNRCFVRNNNKRSAQFLFCFFLSR